MNFFNLSIRSKLRATLALQSVLLIAVGAIGFFGTRTANQNFQMMFEGRMLPASWMHEITARQRKSLEAVELGIIRQDASGVSEAAAAVAANRERINEVWV